MLSRSYNSLTKHLVHLIPYKSTNQQNLLVLSCRCKSKETDETCEDQQENKPDITEENSCSDTDASPPPPPAAPPPSPPSPTGREGYPVRLSEPGKVRMGFIPEEWFSMFYEKTGVTGPYMFGFGLCTFLASKEIYVMEHEYYTGLSVAILSVLIVKKLGPPVAKYLDDEIAKIENAWNHSRELEIKQLELGIALEKKNQWRADGAEMLVDAKEGNIAMQIEAAHRKAAYNVYEEVKRRLDYQVECRFIEKRINHKHMVLWIVKQLVAALPKTNAATEKKLKGDLSAMALRLKSN